MTSVSLIGITWVSRAEAELLEMAEEHAPVPVFKVPSARPDYSGSASIM